MDKPRVILNGVDVGVVTSWSPTSFRTGKVHEIDGGYPSIPLKTKGEAVIVQIKFFCPNDETELVDLQQKCPLCGYSLDEHFKEPA